MGMCHLDMDFDNLAVTNVFQKPKKIIPNNNFFMFILLHQDFGL